jgi:hypothetical protein
MMPWFAFVDGEFVAVGVENEGHAADGGFKGLHQKLHTRGFQFGDGGGEIGHFESHGGALGGGGPSVHAGERKCAIADEILRESPAARGVDDGTGLEPEMAFIKGASPGHVGDGIGGESNFGDGSHGAEIQRRGIVSRERGVAAK